MARLQLKIGGMHCSFCSQSIERAYRGTPGVTKVAVSLAHEEALIEYDADLANETALREVLRDIGYTIRDPDKALAYEQQQEELRRKRAQTLLAGSIGGVAALVMVLMWLGLRLPPWALYLTAGVTAWVVFGVGRDIVGMAVAGLRRRIFNQHVLLFFGAVGGFIAGLLGFVLSGFPTFHFFAAAVFLMTYHLLSGYVATRVRARSQDAVRKLLELRPDTARRIDHDEEVEVPVGDVQAGDRIRVRPGERIPLDGDVVEGFSAVNEAVVTGEPIPVEKTAGDPVIGGAINQSGTLVIEVTATADQGFLHRVARYTEEARALKPGIIQVVDFVLRFFVPGVLVVAGAAFSFWTLGGWMNSGTPDWTRAIYATLTVLVMGYPCALGMATPLALIRGGGSAAARGVLMRSAEAFQVFKDVEVVVLDKTGTITEGKPRVASIQPFAGAEERHVLEVAAAAERASEHPLAQAVVLRAREEGLDVPAVDGFEAVSGHGVVASLDGQELLVGSPRFLEQRDVDVEPAREHLDAVRSAGQTAVVVGEDGRLIGAIGIADRVKDDSRRAIRQLREMGVESIMLTGDQEVTARAVAAQVDIDRVLSGVLPDEKAEAIGQLQEGGRRVAMVGDGINDAPALTRADVGVAIGAGTDIAIESADVVLIHSRLSGVVAAFEVSRNSYRKTKQNLALAFVFNGVGVPLAATGLVHPVWAMAAMVASVSLVLLNSFGSRLMSSRSAADEPPEPDEVTLSVPGMHCEGCAQAISEALHEREDPHRPGSIRAPTGRVAGA